MSADRTTILVIGGAGYIGSHVCKTIHRAGYIPVAYDNLIHGHRHAVKWGPFEHGDLSDSRRLLEVFSTHRPQGVVHLAAFAYVGESVEKPAKYYLNNVAGSLSLLEAMRASNVNTMVFSSTCAVYGVPRTIPITEQTPPDPVNPYGASKLMIERMMRDYHRAYGLNSVSLRYFNAAGADPEGEIGEEHNPETHLIPLILDAASGRREALTVFGNDYPTKDGTCIRDYIHVSDLARAHVLALRLIESSPSTCLSMNLGTGKGYSIRELLEVAGNITGKKIPHAFAARREGDPPALIADPGEAFRRLGWKAEYAEIETIMTHAWDFHQKTFNAH
ncbi:MAG: UDP-glucose 4-epimerase GalE [Chitinispirillaceae bacterium]|nr:UDP-glucose 4-epimerase GalE [Chitinispirillaceae bacterium]